MAHARVQAVLRYVRRLALPPVVEDLTDRQLLRRFAAEQDQDAFALLVRRHGALVRGVCRRALGHAQDAEDAFQATFLVLARKAATVRWRDSVAAWLHAVAARIAAEAAARRARRWALEKQGGRRPRA